MANQNIKGRSCTKELNLFVHALELPVSFNFATMKQSHKTVHLQNVKQDINTDN
jgi:hypothetical protein